MSGCEVQVIRGTREVVRAKRARRWEYILALMKPEGNSEEDIKFKGVGSCGEMAEF